MATSRGSDGQLALAGAGFGGESLPHARGIERVCRGVSGPLKRAVGEAEHRCESTGTVDAMQVGPGLLPAVTVNPSRDDAIAEAVERVS